MSGGAIDSSVTLEEVLTVVGTKRVPLAPELAGYLVLEIAEHADPNGGDVDPKSVFVGEEGTVALVRPKRETTRGDAESSIRSALGRLLDASGTQTPALAATSKRKNGAGLTALVDEIEAALIPVNRAAGRRALARLAREVKRVTLGVGRHTLPSSPSSRPVGESAPLSSQRLGRPPFPPEEEATVPRPKLPSAPDARIESFSQAEVDELIAQFGVSGDNESHARALKSMAGVDPTPPPPVSVSPRSQDLQDAMPRGGVERVERVEPAEADVDTLLSMDSEAPWPADSLASQPAPWVTTGRAGRASKERKLPTQPSQLGPRAALPSAALSSLGWVRGALAALVVAAVAAGSYAMWRFRQSGSGSQVRSAESPAAPTSGDSAPTACLATLIITDVPLNAEVLMHEGQAPVDVTRMPVGARLEFVATAEGYTPKRVVIPAGVRWDTGPDGNPRFEAAVQLDLSRTRGLVDPWPAGEPGSAVGGEGPPGTVRVVATPRGAEIWMLAGIGPEARIDHLRCDRDIDILAAGPATYRKRQHVDARDFVPDEAVRASGQRASVRVARISVTGR
jgi:hypothetical protein